MLGRPELGVTFTKLHCWNLTQYNKCVFLDADTLVLCNVDELFQRDELSAAPDPGWPDCFNSGVFVFRPSKITYTSLLDLALQHGSFDGGDQGLLNSFFSSWSVEDISKHLPFIYNLCASSVYTYLPAFQQFGHQAKIVHFAGAVKPWSPQRNGCHSQSLEQFESLWWKEYHSQTPSAPDTQRTPRRPKQQIQEQEVKVPITGNLDSSSSLLAHFSPSSNSLHSHTKEMMAPRTDRTPVQESPVLEKESPSTETAEVSDLPGAGAEASEDRKGTADEDAQPAEEREAEHRRMWEAGQVDYLGRDAFQNIQKMLDRFLDPQYETSLP
ncbi:glycogenin-2 isoform X2 [Xiphophorus maculatus]|nr:glycogenin-2 isoform X2 [Xiphophorus maculatus]XP_023184934.1 glycogenin-2 isoform X2 [Xiphophorus maculatus]